MTKQTVNGAQNVEFILNKYEFKYSNKYKGDLTSKIIPSKYEFEPNK